MTTGRLVVAHVSDLHFGDHLRRAVEGLVADVVAAAPALTVLTGDSTMRAREREFRQVRALLDQLPAPLLAVAGNHDLPLTSPRRFFDPLDRYRHWVAPDLEPAVEVPGLTALGLQSMPRWRWKNGLVSPRQASRVLAVLGSAPAGDVRLLALHHPPFATGSARLVGRSRLSHAMAAARVDVVLAGHTHVPDVRPVTLSQAEAGGAPVVVVAGTAAGRRVRGTGQSWSLIGIDARTVVVHERYLGRSGWYTGRVVRCPRGSRTPAMEDWR